MSLLYIIPTPIGNLADISERALKQLKELEIIFCEDTRVFMKLQNHYNLGQKKLISFNKDNEQGRVRQIIDYLESGVPIGLLSDAGTPLISDPGSNLIKEIFLRGLEKQITALPGPSALTTALSLCPIDTSRFCFEGFLPHGPKQRRRILRQLKDELRPLVFFESPHRIIKTLQDLLAIFGEDLNVFLARELSKKFEELYFAKVGEIIEKLETQFPNDVQGEIVLVISRDIAGSHDSES